jgi:hypothetical protein
VPSTDVTSVSRFVKKVEELKPEETKDTQKLDHKSVFPSFNKGMDLDAVNKTKCEQTNSKFRKYWCPVEHFYYILCSREMSCSVVRGHQRFERILASMTEHVRTKHSYPHTSLHGVVTQRSAIFSITSQRLAERQRLRYYTR